MKQATLCFLIRDETIWLAMKKKGFGAGKYNGYGGKINENETIEDALHRELLEEASVRAINHTKMGEISYTFPNKPELNHYVHVYVIDKWQGIPKESEEMSPELFTFKDIPYDKMWSNDKHWLPLVLKGQKIKGDIIQDENKTLYHDVRKLQSA
jgi:ADP-ribose pyrophosphatase YjhB (NUDIX family)